MSVYVSPRSATKKLSVLLVGYSGYLGSTLYSHLQDAGFAIIPVTRDAPSLVAVNKSLTFEQLDKHGLPDVDFVINVAGENIMTHPWCDGKKTRIEVSRIETNAFLANLIRDTKSKPYAFLTASCASYYPASEHNIYDESFTLPPTPTKQELADPAVQAAEMSLPYLTRMVREWESASRVYVPALDDKTDLEIEMERIERQKNVTDMKTGIYGSRHTLTPREQQVHSIRYNLLENKDVRVVNLRMGALLSSECPAAHIAEPYLSWGLLSHIGTGEQRTPWVHVDDACRMFIHHMVETQHTGAVNCVAPTITTNKEIVKFIGKAKHIYTHNFGISEDRIMKKFGPVRAHVITKSRNVIPQVALDTGFEFTRPDITSAMQSPTSLYETRVSSYGGVQNLPRHKEYKPKYH